MQTKRKGRVGRCLLRTLGAVVLIAAVLGATAGMAAVIYARRTLSPHLDESGLDTVVNAGASQLYYYEFTDRTARIGERCELEGGRLDGGSHVVPVTYAELPQTLVDAFVAIEDKRFWQHHGVDWLRTAEAGLNFILRGDGRFGASTITQQLVKNLTGENGYSVHRKLQEMVWANDLENRSTKEEILERYLNIINLSQGCYGVGAAADRFFGKTVGELTVAECAAIAGITQNPSYYDPVRFAEHTTERRDVILGEMWAQGYLDETAYREALAEPLTVREQTRERSPIYSWYVDMVIEDVLRDLCAEHGVSREYASRLLWNGGLSIEVAVDPTVQRRVEEYYRDLSHFAVHQNGERAESGMIVIDPKTGDVLGVAGAIGPKAGNRLQSFATGALRPAASAIKPLSVYAPALERGKITWAIVFDDVPVDFLRGKSGKPTVAWPKNASRVYRGLTDVRYAVAQSVNTVAVRVLREIGAEESFRFLHDTLGMEHLIATRTLEDGRTLTDCGEAALALGQMHYGITLRELTAGYTALANGGVYMRPVTYYRVLDAKGRVLLDRTSEGHYAISEQNAAVMTRLLETVVGQGTGKGAALFGGRVAVAGKTGTSSADCDRYFIGYTPEYLAGVWYGFAYPRPLSDVKGNPAVRIWREVMTDILSPSVRAGTVKRQFDQPHGILRVSYCQDSGKRPTDACRADPRGDRTAVGYFVQGSEPHDACDRHVMRVESGREDASNDASDRTPEPLRRVGLLRIKRSFPRSVYVLDQKYAVSS
ncbi:MAG: transglycosylase domain-containing protein [Clostridia bacterium]|nr:transglycosylase domain-containing protein [Clostridia bacterium]